MKPMNEVFELPVTFRPIKSKDVASDFNYVVIDNHGADVAECYSHTDGQHAAHAINSHDLLVDVLQYVANEINASDEWWMDSPDRGGFDIDRIEAALKQARGE